MPRRKRFRHLYERAGIWYARVRHPDGRRRRESTDCTDPEAASLWLVRRERELQGTAAGQSPEAAQHTVAEALAHYVDVCCAGKSRATVLMYDLAARTIAERLGGVRVNALTRDDVLRYYQRRLEDGVARSTVLKERITLRAALKVAGERKRFLGSVDSVVPPFAFSYVPRRVFLRREDFPKLLERLEPKRARFVRVAVFSGCERSALEALTWADDLGEHLRIPGTKTAHRDRLIPIGPELRAVLDETPKDERHGPIVEHWSNVNRDLGIACEAAGISPRVTCHDLRRTFGSWLAQRGASTKAIGALLGHAPGSTMADRTYSVLTDAALSDVVGLLGADCATPVPNEPAKEPQTAHSVDSAKEKRRPPPERKPPQLH